VAVPEEHWERQHDGPSGRMECVGYRNSRERFKEALAVHEVLPIDRVPEPVTTDGVVADGVDIRQPKNQAGDRDRRQQEIEAPVGSSRGCAIELRSVMTNIAFCDRFRYSVDKGLRRGRCVRGGASGARRDC
jgi:hypothetical protein